MNKLNLTLAIFLALFITIGTLCLGQNVVLRMPDLYQFELKSTQALDKMELNIEDDRMGDFISGYMFGTVDEFQMYEEFMDKERNVFTFGDQIAAQNLRFNLNISMAVAVICIILGLIAFILLHRQERYWLLRTVLKVSVAGITILGVGIISLLNWPAAKIYIVSRMTGYTFGAEDSLPLIFGTTFANHSSYAIVAVSLILDLILGYIIWKFTKDKKIFF